MYVCCAPSRAAAAHSDVLMSHEVCLYGLQDVRGVLLDVLLRQDAAHLLYLCCQGGRESVVEVADPFLSNASQGVSQVRLLHHISSPFERAVISPEQRLQQRVAEGVWVRVRSAQWGAQSASDEPS